MQEKQFDVPVAPRDLFQNQNNSPLGNEDIVAYVASHIDYVPWKGIIIHIEDASYPKKGFPTPEAIAALNIIKALIKETLRYPLSVTITDKNKLLNSFNFIFNKTFNAYKLKEEYLCPAAYNFYLFTFNVLKDAGIRQDIANETAFNLAHIVEYDDAYRYRIQDLASEFNQHAPIREETNRLLVIFKQRTTDLLGVKLNHIIKFAPMILLIPKYRTIINRYKHLIKNMEFDDADRYWAFLKDSHYDFCGQPFPERKEGLRIPQPYKVNY